MSRDGAFSVLQLQLRGRRRVATRSEVGGFRIRIQAVADGQRILLYKVPKGGSQGLSKAASPRDRQQLLSGVSPVPREILFTPPAFPGFRLHPQEGDHIWYGACTGPGDHGQALQGQRQLTGHQPACPTGYAQSAWCCKALDCLETFSVSVDT